MKNQLFIGGAIGLVLGYFLFRKKCPPCNGQSNSTNNPNSPLYIIPNVYVPPTTAAPIPPITVPPTTLAPTAVPAVAFNGAPFKQKYRKM